MTVKTDAEIVMEREQAKAAAKTRTTKVEAGVPQDVFDALLDMGVVEPNGRVNPNDPKKNGQAKYHKVQLTALSGDDIAAASGDAAVKARMEEFRASAEEEIGAAKAMVDKLSASLDDANAEVALLKEQNEALLLEIADAKGSE